jgi:2-polyprenyl-3-methyl-5-hydroxy-6-metoxy-1,4-benzoquinol methylase
MPKQSLLHERSYKQGLISFVHRARLKTIRKLIKEFGGSSDSWADFGCSNGFIIEQIVEDEPDRFALIHGFDHEASLLEIARAKNIARASFYSTDLNARLVPQRNYRLVTCFETLEHVGDYRAGFRNVAAHVQVGGMLIVAVPIEIGVIGVVKFLGRLVLRRNPYRGFFNGMPQAMSYFFTLMRGRDIESFRQPSRLGWGPHLGFDFKQLFDFIDAEYLRKGAFEMRAAISTAFGCNAVYVLERVRLDQ